jgi:DNA repair protein RecO
MTLREIKGITLSSIDFKEKSKIVKIYTDTRGLLSFITNCASKKNFAMISFASPCTYSEVIYFDKNRALFKVKEIAIKNLHLSLRDSFEKITAAITITKSILTSQDEDKPNITLFKLLKAYLEKLSHAVNFSSYVCSFQLKLLHLEGLIYLTNKCSVCNNFASHILKGDFFCAKHTSYNSIEFSPTEIKTLINLALFKKFSDIESIKTPMSLKLKIQELFESIFI